MLKTWICIVCELIYDESAGWPDEGSAAGTPWSEVPDDWLCPDGAVSEANFEMREL